MQSASLNVFIDVENEK